MLFSRLFFSALVILAEIEGSVAGAVIYQSNGLGRRHRYQSSRTSRITHEVDAEYDLSRRAASSQQTSNNTTSPSSGLDSICSKAISHLGHPSNPAGLLACYDIVTLDTKTGSFQSTVQIYQSGQPSGTFKGVNLNSTILNVEYPAAYLSALSRRLTRRTDTGTAANLIVSKSYAGELSSTLQLSKLNTTQLISLLVPNITIEALSPTSKQPVFAQLDTTDIAFFPTGTFSQTSQDVVSAALGNPVLTAKEAIAAAAVFVLPGTTFGIFPTGLIVTSSWTVLFVSTFAYGTLGRIRHKRKFRRRIANPRFGSG